MKELLSIKEKAHRYDKALRVVEKLHSSWKETQNRAADEIEEAFPELRVSEDERIRKELIEFFNQFENGELRGVDITPWIAWLEKQGEEKPIKEHNICTFCEDKYGCVSLCPTKLIEEQKPADKVEPKFKVGDSIKTANEEPLTITEITDNGYWSEDLFICNFDDAAKWELVEQEPVDKFEPKFKVGDKIIRKEFGGDFIHNPHKIIQVDILDKKYRLEGGLDAHFLEEDDWELVEQEPKFNVGDWLVCCNYEPEQIIGIRNDMYEMSNGDIRPIKMINNNHNIRLWTIQDAKDGDILELDCGIGIFKDKCIDGCNIHCYCYYSNQCVLEINKDSLYDTYQSHPATKEQRDLLFQKIKEAGYEWNEEKKELRKIEQKPEIKDDVLSRFAFYQYDDDTIYLSSLFVRESDRGRGYGSKVLKAAEEVAKTFGISKIRLKVERNTWMERWYEKNGYEYLSSEGKYNWLENRIIDIKPDKIEQKSAWSEVDETKLRTAQTFINNTSLIGVDGIKEATINWLKSLKERIKNK